MKLTEYKNEDALDLLADLLEPMTTIFTDKEVVERFKTDSTLKGVQYALKHYKKELIVILARLDGVEPKDYNGTLIKMTNQLMDIVNDEELMSFFTVPEQMDLTKSSGSVTESTEGSEH